MTTAFVPGWYKVRVRSSTTRAHYFEGTDTKRAQSLCLTRVAQPFADLVSEETMKCLLCRRALRGAHSSAI